MLNTEQTLTRVLQIVHALDEDEAAIYNAVSKNPYEWEKAVGPIPQLYFLEQDLRRTLVEEAAASAKSEKFSLQSFILANLVQPNQQVILYEYTGVQTMCQSWLGKFCGIPDSYVHRTVDKVFVPAYPDMLPFNSTLYILLAPET